MIGINKYEKLNIRFQLRGCVNDQKMMRQLITERFGFNDEDIIWLVSDHGQEEEGQPKPTRENILDALDRLAGMGKYEDETENEAFVREGDLVLISYTGHGSRLKEPPDQRDEADGYDSTIVPYDSDRPRPAGRGGANLDITDDEIFIRLQKIQEKARHVVLYFDCCHSGTISRDLTGEVARSLEEDDRYDGVERPWGGARMLGSDGQIPAKGPSGWLELNEGYVLLAGCADDEVAREYRDPETGEPCGALTYHIVREMAQGSGELTYRDVFDRARNDVNALFSSQHPQIEGDWNRKLFDVAEVKVEPYVSVERLSNKRVKIAAGSAHGGTAESVWELRVGDLENYQILGEVLIDKVGQLSMEGVLQDDGKLPDSFGQGTRAIQVVQALGKQSRLVAVDGPAQYRAELKKLRQFIKESVVCQLAENDPAELSAVLQPPRSAAEAKLPNAYAPQLGAIDKPTWLIVGQDRRIMPSPPHTILEENALGLTFYNLETWARYLNTRQIKPRGGDPLAGKFEVKLTTSDSQALPIDARSGLPVIEDGQEVKLELINHHSKPLYYIMYNMTVTGAVERAWPPPEAREPIAAYDRLPLEFPIELPENFPVGVNGGRETIKFMVTPKYVNFDSLVQGGGRLIKMSRVKAGKTDINEESWTVVQLDYYLKRAGD
jgi:hypothetical protein